jgi:hypothetical protein
MPNAVRVTIITPAVILKTRSTFPTFTFMLSPFSLKDERQTFYKLLDGENKYIGIKSFFEKTKPEWK